MPVGSASLKKTNIHKKPAENEYKKNKYSHTHALTLTHKINDNWCHYYILETTYTNEDRDKIHRTVKMWRYYFLRYEKYYILAAILRSVVNKPGEY